MLEQEKKEILCLECRTGKKKTMVELESGSVLHRGKSAIEQYTDRDSKKCSNREG